MKKLKIAIRITSLITCLVLTVIIQITGFMLVVIGAFGIATGVCFGPLILVLPGAQLMAFGALALNSHIPTHM